MILRQAELEMILAGLLAVVGCNSAARQATECQAEVETGSTWYYFEWMAKAPYAPTFRVLDTESRLGPYAERLKTITLKDLIKMHGHPCDGLVTAACAMSVALDRLYPDRAIDRTDTCCITNNSPCYGDVAAYLTGGRIRFGTQKIDPSLGNEFILYRVSTGQAVKVSLRAGVFPERVAAVENKIRSGDFTTVDMRRCQQWQWDYARALLEKPLDASFQVQSLPVFSWEADAYPNAGTRGDVVNKDVE